MANRTTISWCTHSLNVLVGCNNRCDDGKWCYARRMANRGLTDCDLCKRFIPHIHPGRLNDPILRRKKSAVIFMDSMSDWFSDGMQQEWRNDCFRAMHSAPQHQYIILTKKPENITEEDQAQLTVNNIWLGVSITDYAHDFWRVWELHRKARGHCIVSIEPLLGPIFPLSPPDESLLFHFVEWTILGGMTGPGAVAPREEWIKAIHDACLNNRIPLWEKENLPGYGEKFKRIQQAPPPIAEILFREANR